MKMKFEEILRDLSKKIYKPVYFLHGEEEFFIDVISDHIETNVLDEAQKEFNQTILYGKDTNAGSIIDMARRFPMMSNYQVVIVKEAQALDKLDELTVYAGNPSRETILVICYKHKAYDSRKSLIKTIMKTGVVFKSDRLYESKIPAWINDQLKEQGYTITPEAAQLLTGHLGNDLSRIRNELGKLVLNLEPGQTVDAGIIQENIGISKDFNIFELQKAMGKGDLFKANHICQYFAANPKANPFVLTIALLYQFFTKVLIFHSVKDKTNNNSLAAELSVSPYFVGDYRTAAKNFGIDKTIYAISLLREYDMKSKGVGNDSATQGELLREMVFRIMH
jgi:DNA polymerase III subunit delta